MAVLPDQDRFNVWANVMREGSAEHSTVVNLSKADLRAAINAADDWVDANAASFNAALPLAARTNLTATQKSRILVNVVHRRWEVG